MGFAGIISATDTTTSATDTTASATDTSVSAPDTTATGRLTHGDRSDSDMATVEERFGLTGPQLWAAGVTSGVLALVVGSLLFPETVYDRFLWQYFWGPVQADANSAACAVRSGGSVQYLFSAGECAAASEPVAYPGYTLVSEVGYAVTLIVALTGLVLLLRVLQIGTETRFYYALVPFFFFGGVFRVVEDADNALEATLFPYPWDTLVISPIIYFTVFVITLGAILVGVGYGRRTGSDYTRPVAVIGTLVTAATVLYLASLSVSEGVVEFHPQVITAMLATAVLATGGVWVATQRLIPWVHEGTGKAGLVVLFAHALDGTANVIGLDYMTLLGAGPNLVPKHPVNQFVVDTAGAAWPFLVIKLVAAVFVLWIFDEPLFEESPRYGVLLLIAVTAVGLGPGSRDMLRATFGI